MPGADYPSRSVSDPSATDFQSSEHRYIAPIVGPDDERRFTDSGIEIDKLYDPSDVAPDLEERLGEPGDYPFTRGVHDGMYRDRLWTMRQYAGFSSPEDTNERYRYLIEHGSTGLSMAFDLPTQLGRDSDDPLCDGEVGRTGVPIDTIEDMRICFDQIPLDQVSTSMTINAPASVLLLLYELVGEEQGVDSQKLRGTVQNDVLKEYMARGNYIYPPEPTMRLTTDIFEYCQENVPKWNTISISGYHIREKGCSAVQEVAFTLSNAIAYVEAALDRGLEIDAFAPRLAFFFNCHNNVFQEIAKFRAVRRMWAEIVRDRFGSENPRSQMIRFHTQTGGVTLQAQQPEVNIIRVALQGFAAVSGGTQSLHTNGFDEALALPTERSARIALRTQQVIAYESGATDTVDPFAGSYFVESLTDEIELRAKELMAQVEDMGGSVQSLDFMQKEIEESASSYHERYKSGQDVIVGVNKFVTDTIDDVDILKVDPEAERRQVERLEEAQGEPRPGRGRRTTRGARRRRPVGRQSAAADEGGAARRRLDRRGLGDAARRVRRVPGRGLLLGPLDRSHDDHRPEVRLGAPAEGGGDGDPGHAGGGAGPGRVRRPDRLQRQARRLLGQGGTDRREAPVDEHPQAPLWILSAAHHKAISGLWPDFEPQPMPTAEEMVETTDPDDMLRWMTDGPRLTVNRWLRTEHLQEDVLVLLDEIDELTSEARNAVNAVPWVGKPYDHDVEKSFTRRAGRAHVRTQPRLDGGRAGRLRRHSRARAHIDLPR